MLKLTLVLLVFCVSISDACRFLPKTKEEKYCGSEFAGIATVATNGYPCGPYSFNRCYGIKDFQQIKGVSITPIVLQTGLDSAGCGVKLTQGNTYFIASNVVNPYVVGLYTFHLYDDWSLLSSSVMTTKAQEYQAIVCPAVSPKPPIKTLPTTGPSGPGFSVE